MVERFSFLLLYLRHPIRMVAWIPITLSLLWGVLDGWGLLFSILGAMLGTLMGERVSASSLKSSALFLLFLGLQSILFLFIHWSSDWVWLSSILSPHRYLFLRALLTAFASMFFAVALLRALARRSNLVRVIEFWILIFASLTAFLPHRNQNVLRPLWLSDFSWKWGLEPTLMFGVIGAIFGCILLFVSILENASSQIQPDQKAKVLPLQKGQKNDNQNRYKREGYYLLGRLWLPLLIIPFLLLFALIFSDPQRLKKYIPPSGADSLSKEIQDQESKGGGGRSGNGEGKGKNQNKEKNNNGGGGQPQPAALVILETDYEPPSQYFYFRQETFTQLVGTRLQATTSDKIPYDGIRGFPFNAVQNTVSVERTKRERIDGKVYMLSDHAAPFGLEGIQEYKPIANPRPGIFARTYHFVSYAQKYQYPEFFGYPTDNDDWDVFVRMHHLEVPDNPKYKELAQEIISSIPENVREDEFTRAVAIKLWLDEKMKYTRAVKHDKAKDPTAAFLFGDVNQYIGYCVHSAHAAVYLWRSIGIPARIGVGYAVDAEDVNKRRGAGILITNADAHAWPELYLEDIGWVPLDIAPAENLEEQQEGQPNEILRSLMDMAEASPDSDFRNPIDWAKLWATYRPILILLTQTTIALLLISLYLWKWYRRRRVVFTKNPLDAYIAALDSLSELGIRRKYGEEMTAFARRVNIEGFEYLSQNHQRHFFDSKGTNRQIEIQQFEHFEIELSKRFPVWRRAIGALHPFSIFFSR